MNRKERDAQRIRGLIEENTLLRRRLLIVTESENAEAGEHEALRAENSDLRARLAAVEALADEWTSDKSQWHGTLAYRLRAVLGEVPTVGSPVDIEQACEVMHDAYEQAAKGAGWETQEASRVPWADVPDANKATMRSAVTALMTHFGRVAGVPPETATDGDGFCYTCPPGPCRCHALIAPTDESVHDHRPHDHPEDTDYTAAQTCVVCGVRIVWGKTGDYRTFGWVAAPTDDEPGCMVCGEWENQYDAAMKHIDRLRARVAELEGHICQEGEFFQEGRDALVRAEAAEARVKELENTNYAQWKRIAALEAEKGSE